MATAPPDAQQPADADEARRLQQCAQKWIAELTVSEKAQRQWLDRARKIVRRYKKDDSQTVRDRRFAMLWSNTQTIHPAVYSRTPQPVVTRRFNDQDPVGRVASEILERALSYSLDVQDFDGVLRQASFDFVLLARGQAWERYEPTFGPQVVPEIPLQVVTVNEGADPEYVDEAGNVYDAEKVKGEEGALYAEGEPYSPVEYEESITDYVNWEDFGHSVARTWDEVGYVWRRVYLDRKQLIARFGENIGKLVPLDWGPVKQGNRDETNEYQKKAAIYEIWDKATRKVYWVSKSWNSRPLDERDDPLGLPGFFPCPRPLLGSTANDTTLPIPDYVYYQDQAEEIDELTQRIAHLQKALKVRGFYAGDVKTNLNNLLNSENNTLIPVPDWQTLKDGGGVAGKIEWLPINQVVATLQACVEQRALLIQDVYQITGVADIMRGMNDPRATATAEALKGQWGTLRIRERQIELMRFARDLLRLKAAVIATKFSADTLKTMTGVPLPTNAEKQQLQAGYEQYQMVVQQAQMAGQPPPPPPMDPAQFERIMASPTWEDVEQLLQNSALRQFRIDIETDSTIEPNEQAEKAQATEFITAVGTMINQAGSAIQAQPMLAPMFGEMIKWGARKFRAGRQLEDVIDATMDKIVAQGVQPPQGEQPEPPDQTPIAVAQIEQQTAQMQEAAETQREKQRLALDAAELELRRGDQQLKLVAINRDPHPQALA
jgi:hypothetical protein